MSGPEQLHAAAVTPRSGARLRRPMGRRGALVRWSGLAGTEAFGPAIVVAVALSLIVLATLASHHGNPTSFVRFGRRFAAAMQPPPHAVLVPGTGYDGQYFFVLGRDPLVLAHRTLLAFAYQGFRLARVAYPALAFVLSGGREAALPWTLLAVNLLAILAITVAFSHYAIARGWSGWWGLAVGLLPGLSYAVLGDLSDALAVSAMLGGLLAWRLDRRWAAASLLTLAVLAREPALVAAVAIAVGAFIGGARQPAASAVARVRGGFGALRRESVVVALPVLAFVLWQAYIRWRFGASTAAPPAAFTAPFGGIVTEFGRAFAQRSAIDAAWDLGYLLMMCAAIGVCAVLAWREPSAPALAALLFALTLPFLSFGYAWSYTRLSAPMFACLLLVGLERRSRPALAICVAVAALGALVPLGIG